MKVLIGITSKNRAAILPKAITAALSQTYPDKAVAVFDDASDDNTRELVSQFNAVQWTLADKPVGYLFARNKFMRETDADVYCSLDDDSWFMSDDGLAAAMEHLRTHPSCAAIAFDILSPDRPAPTGSDSTPRPVGTFIGCGHLLRLDIVRMIGGYTPNPGYYGGEEKDLAIQLMDRGYSIDLLPGVHIWHDKTNVARNLRHQHRSGVCNDLTFAWRRIPSRYLAPVLVGKVFNHLRFSIIRGYTTPCLLGMFDFARLLFTFRIPRKPVKPATYRNFRRLNRQ
ncbi:MAG: glycosyltransferase [Cyclobacteriaceae bacterium]|nr:glycosyltransferase [Cyclobacteriaceae bacterium]